MLHYNKFTNPIINNGLLIEGDLDQLNNTPITTFNIFNDVDGDGFYDPQEDNINDIIISTPSTISFTRDNIGDTVEMTENVHYTFEVTHSAQGGISVEFYLTEAGISLLQDSIAGNDLAIFDIPITAGNQNTQEIIEIPFFFEMEGSPDIIFESPTPSDETILDDDLSAGDVILEYTVSTLTNTHSNNGTLSLENPHSLVLNDTNSDDSQTLEEGVHYTVNIDESTNTYTFTLTEEGVTFIDSIVTENSNWTLDYNNNFIYSYEHNGQNYTETNEYNHSVNITDTSTDREITYSHSQYGEHNAPDNDTDSEDNDGIIFDPNHPPHFDTEDAIIAHFDLSGFASSNLPDLKMEFSLETSGGEEIYFIDDYLNASSILDGGIAAWNNNSDGNIDEVYFGLTGGDIYNIINGTLTNPEYDGDIVANIKLYDGTNPSIEASHDFDILLNDSGNDREITYSHSQYGEHNAPDNDTDLEDDDGMIFDPENPPSGFEARLATFNLTGFNIDDRGHLSVEITLTNSNGDIFTIVDGVALDSSPSQQGISPNFTFDEESPTILEKVRIDINSLVHEDISDFLVDYGDAVANVRLYDNTNPSIEANHDFDIILSDSSTNEAPTFNVEDLEVTDELNNDVVDDNIQYEDDSTSINDANFVFTYVESSNVLQALVNNLLFAFDDDQGVKMHSDTQSVINHIRETLEPGDEDVSITYSLEMIDEDGLSHTDEFTITIKAPEGEENTAPTFDVEDLEVTDTLTSNVVDDDIEFSDDFTSINDADFGFALNEVIGLPSGLPFGFNLGDISFSVTDNGISMDSNSRELINTIKETLQPGDNNTVLTYSVTATDEGGLSHTDEFTITIEAPEEEENTPPTFNVEDLEVTDTLTSNVVDNDIEFSDDNSAIGVSTFAFEITDVTGLPNGFNAEDIGFNVTGQGVYLTPESVNLINNIRENLNSGADDVVITYNVTAANHLGEGGEDQDGFTITIKAPEGEENTAPTFDVEDLEVTDTLTNNIVDDDIEFSDDFTSINDADFGFTLNEVIGLPSGLPFGFNLNDISFVRTGDGILMDSNSRELINTIKETLQPGDDNTVLTYSVTATDEGGLSHTDEFTITIKAPEEEENTAPTFNVEDITISEEIDGMGDSLYIDSDIQYSDDSTSINNTLYEFEYVGSSNVPDGYANGASNFNFAFSYDYANNTAGIKMSAGTRAKINDITEALQPGDEDVSITYRLEMTDEDGLSHTDEFTITIKAPEEGENTAPTFDVEDITISEEIEGTGDNLYIDSDIDFSDDSTSINNIPFSFSYVESSNNISDDLVDSLIFNFDNDQGVKMSLGTKSAINNIRETLQPGDEDVSITYSLTLTDEGGLSHTDEFTITIEAPEEVINTPEIENLDLMFGLEGADNIGTILDDNNEDPELTLTDLTYSNLNPINELVIARFTVEDLPSGYSFTGQMDGVHFPTSNLSFRQTNNGQWEAYLSSDEISEIVDTDYPNENANDISISLKILDENGNIVDNDSSKIHFKPINDNDDGNGLESIENLDLMFGFSGLDSMHPGGDADDNEDNPLNILEELNNSDGGSPIRLATFESEEPIEGLSASLTFEWGNGNTGQIQLMPISLVEGTTNQYEVLALPSHLEDIRDLASDGQTINAGIKFNHGLESSITYDFHMIKEDLNQQEAPEIDIIGNNFSFNESDLEADTQILEFNVSDDDGDPMDVTFSVAIELSNGTILSSADGHLEYIVDADGNGELFITQDGVDFLQENVSLGEEVTGTIEFFNITDADGLGGNNESATINITGDLDDDDDGGDEWDGENANLNLLEAEFGLEGVDSWQYMLHSWDDGNEDPAINLNIHGASDENLLIFTFEADNPTITADNFHLYATVHKANGSTSGPLGSQFNQNTDSFVRIVESEDTPGVFEYYLTPAGIDFCASVPGAQNLIKFHVQVDGYTGSYHDNVTLPVHFNYGPNSGNNDDDDQNSNDIPIIYDGNGDEENDGSQSGTTFVTLNESEVASFSSVHQLSDPDGNTGDIQLVTTGSFKPIVINGATGNAVNPSYYSINVSNGSLEFSFTPAGVNALFGDNLEQGENAVFTAIYHVIDENGNGNMSEPHTLSLSIAGENEGDSNNNDDDGNSNDNGDIDDNIGDGDNGNDDRDDDNDNDDDDNNFDIIDRDEDDDRDDEDRDDRDDRDDEEEDNEAPTIKDGYNDMDGIEGNNTTNLEISLEDVVDGMVVDKFRLSDNSDLSQIEIDYDSAVIIDNTTNQSHNFNSNFINLEIVDGNVVLSFNEGSEKLIHNLSGDDQSITVSFNVVDENGNASETHNIVMNFNEENNDDIDDGIDDGDDDNIDDGNDDNIDDGNDDNIDDGNDDNIDDGNDDDNDDSESDVPPTLTIIDSEIGENELNNSPMLIEFTISDDMPADQVEISYAKLSYMNEDIFGYSAEIEVPDNMYSISYNNGVGSINLSQEAIDIIQDNLDVNEMLNFELDLTITDNDGNEASYTDIPAQVVGQGENDAPVINIIVSETYENELDSDSTIVTFEIEDENHQSLEITDMEITYVEDSIFGGDEMLTLDPSMYSYQLDDNGNGSITLSDTAISSLQGSVEAGEQFEFFLSMTASDEYGESHSVSDVPVTIIGQETSENIINNIINYDFDESDASMDVNSLDEDYSSEDVNDNSMDEMNLDGNSMNEIDLSDMFEFDSNTGEFIIDTYGLTPEMQENIQIQIGDVNNEDAIDNNGDDGIITINIFDEDTII